MGIYLYGLTSTGKIAAKNLTGSPVGAKVPLFPFVYRHKYYVAGLDASNKNDKAVERAERKAIKANADPLFQHLVTIGKPSEGDPVYQLKNDQLLWDDCNAFPGTVVGRLVKDGRSWVVQEAVEAPNAEEIQKFVQDHGLAEAPRFCMTGKSFMDHKSAPVTVTNFDENGDCTSSYFFKYGRLFEHKIGRDTVNSVWIKVAKSYLDPNSAPTVRTVLIIPKLEQVWIYNQTAARVAQASAN